MTEIKLNDNNTNKGTSRGKYMVKTSMEQVGPRRSAVADKNGVIIAGNKSVEAALAAGFDLEIVSADPDKLVVLQFDDLDINAPGEEGEKARLYEMLDNRAAQVGLEWDVDQVHGRHEQGLDLLLMFTEGELANEFDIELRETNTDLLAMLASPEDTDDIDGEANEDADGDNVVPQPATLAADNNQQGSTKLAPRYPVPIVLTVDQKAKWEEFKKCNGVRNDLKAFLYLLDLFFEPGEEGVV